MWYIFTNALLSSVKKVMLNCYWFCFQQLVSELSSLSQLYWNSTQTNCPHTLGQPIWHLFAPHHQTAFPEVPHTELTAVWMLCDCSFCLHILLWSLAQFPAQPFPARVCSYCSCKSPGEPGRKGSTWHHFHFLAMKTWGHNSFVHNSPFHCSLKAYFGLTLIHFLTSV